MIRRIGPLAVVLALAGCEPKNAELLDGSFTILVASSVSAIAAEGIIDMQDFDQTWNVDCRQLDPDGHVENLEDSIGTCVDGFLQYTDPDTDADAPVYNEQWVNFDGFNGARQAMDPWRGEAVVTSEGDLQLTFHHCLQGNCRLGGEDFRFAIVVDPRFQPRTCQEDPDGNVAWEPVDGDWLGGWSDIVGDAGGWFTGDGTDGTLIPLNSGSYQFNPSDTEEFWSFPQEWRAGYAIARWGPEDFFNRTTRYGDPAAYAYYEQDDNEPPTLDQIYYVGMADGEDPADNGDFQAEKAKVLSVAQHSQAEWDAMTPDDWKDIYQPAVEVNDWRTPDGFAAGLDGWVGLHYSWIRFDQAADELDVGNEASGEFRLVLEAGESQSRLMVQGTFTVDKIKKDTWVTKNINQVKLEENETELCGESFAKE